MTYREKDNVVAAILGHLTFFRVRYATSLTCCKRIPNLSNSIFVSAGFSWCLSFVNKSFKQNTLRLSLPHKTCIISRLAIAPYLSD